MALVRVLQRIRGLSPLYQSARAMSQDQAGRWGSGAGKGGGSGGSIRESGGVFGEIEAAREEEYFRKLQTQQLKALHDHLEDEVHFQQSEINRLNDELKRRQTKLERLKKDLAAKKKKDDD